MSSSITDGPGALKWRSMASAYFRKLSILLFELSLVASSIPQVSAEYGNWTAIHEAGRCALKGNCGKQSFFGGELPCPDNSLAASPEAETRKKLVAICGEAWSDGDVCCDGDQVIPHQAENAEGSS